MGASCPHQPDVQEADNNIWGPKDGRPGEIPLPLPFHDPKRITNRATEGLLNVEGRAIRQSRRQEKRKDGSAGSTAPASTPMTRGPWSRTTSHRSEGDLYPDEHPFIRTLKDSDDPRETPYAATTIGTPLYKGSYRLKRG